jgi:hypothetical protein
MRPRAAAVKQPYRGFVAALETARFVVAFPTRFDFAFDAFFADDLALPVVETRVECLARVFTCFLGAASAIEPSAKVAATNARRSVFRDLRIIEWSPGLAVAPGNARDG